MEKGRILNPGDIVKIEDSDYDLDRDWYASKGVRPGDLVTVLEVEYDILIKEYMIHVITNAGINMILSYEDIKPYVED